MKKIIVLLSVLILLSVGFSGCLSSENKVPTKNPREPSIVVDSEGNVHIVWYYYKKLSFPTSYIKLDNNGEQILKVNPLLTGIYSQIFKDNEDNIYVIRGNFSLVKLGYNGEILKERRISNNSFLGSLEIDINKNNFIYIGYIEAVSEFLWLLTADTDGKILNEIKTSWKPNWESIKLSVYSNDSILLLWSLNNKVYYVQREINGNIKLSGEINSSFPYIKTGDILTDTKNNIYILWNEYNAKYTYLKKLSPNGTEIFTKEVLNIRIVDAKIDFEDNIHLIGRGGYYAKLNSDGGILINMTKFTDEVYEETGKLAIDKNGNAHIVWYYIEETFRHSMQGEIPEYYYTVYYSKIDKNGNIIINEMVIDKDEKQTDYSNYIFFAIIIIGIAIVIAILIFIRKNILKSKRYNCEKCKGKLIFVQQYQRWYCEKCKEYK